MHTKTKEGRRVAHKSEKAQVRIDPALRRAVNVLAAEAGKPPYVVTEAALREYIAQRNPALLSPTPTRPGAPQTIARALTRERDAEAE
jgi:hypothetical protein